MSEIEIAGIVLSTISLAHQLEPRLYALGSETIATGARLARSQNLLHTIRELLTQNPGIFQSEIIQHVNFAVGELGRTLVAIINVIDSPSTTIIPFSLKNELDIRNNALQPLIEALNGKILARSELAEHQAGLVIPSSRLQELEYPIHDAEVASYVANLMRRQKSFWEKLEFIPKSYLCINIWKDSVLHLKSDIADAGKNFFYIIPKEFNDRQSPMPTSWLRSCSFQDSGIFLGRSKSTVSRSRSRVNRSRSTAGNSSQPSDGNGSESVQAQPSPQLHLVTSNPGLESSGHSTLPFQSASFVSLMNAFKLPSEFIVTLLAGTPIFKRVGNTGKNEKIWKFTMRTPLSSSNNWTLVFTWDCETLTTRAFLHGMQRKELSKFKLALNDYKGLPPHPLLLPVILCDMITESDSNEIKHNAEQLYKVELRTNYLKIDRSGIDQRMTANTTNEDDFEDLTRMLNAATSRLAFLESRIHSISSLVDATLKFASEEQKQYLETHSLSKDDDEEWRSMQAGLVQQLENLRGEHVALLIEISCNQKIAQGQLQILYNLTAQRDNRDNLQMASISKNIAATTKDDSFAMRTIAFMTITFLPATAVSSIFSMSMFDWQASSGTAVVSGRFWIYWTVAIPLTIVVIVFWLFWVHKHKEHEDRRDGSNTSMSSANETTISQLRSWIDQRFSRRPRRRWPWSSKEQNQEEEVDSEELLEGMSSAVDPQRMLEHAETFVQGPMR